MDVKKWNALLAAVQAGSFNKAAEHLGYTQSGLTYMMNALEAEVGFPLLHRGWEGIRLTKEGERLLPAIRALCSSAAALQEQIAEANGRLQRHICIGTYASISVHWLPGIIAEFQKEHPGVELEIRIGSRKKLESWLSEDEVTLCICDRLQVSDAEWIPLYVDPLLAVLPKGHPAAKKKSFSAGDLGDIPFLMPATSSAGGVQLQSYAPAQRALKVETEDDAVLLSMTARNMGVCVLPELTLRGRAQEVVLRPLSPPASRSLGVMMKQENQTAASRSMIMLLRSKLETPADLQE